MYGIYINCNHAQFIDLILSGAKPYETRKRNMLRNLIGKRVALIETGKGPAMIRGFATISSAERINFDNIDARKSARIFRTAYDIQPDGAKWFYKLSDVQNVDPFHSPADRVNHGRSWTEFTLPDMSNPVGLPNR